MDFNFSEDQQQLRDAVRRWVNKAYTFERRREIVAEGGFSRAAYTQLAELGLTALAVPEAHGGLGHGPVDVMVAMEELGRGIVLEPLAQAVVASAVLSQYAPAEAQAQWLPKIASGEALVVLAHQERKARWRLDVCSATATASGSGHVINAHKSLVPAGDQADTFLVPAQLNGHIALFLVERGASGVALRGYGTQDGGRAAELQCTDTPATLLTQHGLTALTLALDVANAALCAEAVGAMEQTLAITVDYMN
ncbi:acyl-CoA dehydrogenase family protein, partial [Acidovorax cavernicola]